MGMDIVLQGLSELFQAAGAFLFPSELAPAAVAEYGTVQL